MELYKTERLICKNAKADRYPSGLTWAGSILGRPIGIVRLRAVGRAGRGRDVAGALLPRRSSAGLHQNGVSRGRFGSCSGRGARVRNGKLVQVY